MNVTKAAAQYGFTVDHIETIGSTNDAAMERLRSGGSGDHWILADQQVQGRGRLGRVWTSKPGNLYASVTLRDPCPMAIGYQLGFVAALAIDEALRACGVPRDRLSLKWPNDVLLDGAKISGLLIEGTSVDGQFGAVIGCGINVTHHPADTPYPATDLLTAGFDCSVTDVFINLVSAFRDNIQLFDEGRGFPALRESWLLRARGFNEAIVVRRQDGALNGIFRGLDAEGRLLLEKDGAVIPVIAGDIFYSDLAHP